jgi:hypothetical protein
MPKKKSFLPYAGYVIASALAIYFAPHIQEVIHGFGFLDNYINYYLSFIFSSSEFGIHLRSIVALMVTPMVIVVPLALIYQRIKHKSMPYLPHIAWILWLITALSRILLIQEGL